MSSSKQHEVYNNLNLPSQLIEVTLGSSPSERLLRLVGLAPVYPPKVADLRSYRVHVVSLAFFVDDELQAEWDDLPAMERQRLVHTAEVDLGRDTGRPQRSMMHAVQAAETLASCHFTKAMLAVGIAHGWTLRLHAEPDRSAVVRSWTQEDLIAQGMSMAQFAREVVPSIAGELALLTLDVDDSALCGHNLLNPWLHLSRGGRCSGPGFSSRQRDDNDDDDDDDDDSDAGDDRGRLRCAVDEVCYIVDRAHLIARSVTDRGFKLTLASVNHTLMRGASSGGTGFQRMFRTLRQQARTLAGDVDLTIARDAEGLDAEQVQAALGLRLRSNDVTINMLPLGPTLHRMFDKAMWHVCPFSGRPVWLSRDLVPKLISETWTERTEPLAILFESGKKLLPALLTNSCWAMHETSAPRDVKAGIQSRAGMVLALRKAYSLRPSPKKRKLADARSTSSSSTGPRASLERSRGPQEGRTTRAARHEGAEEGVEDKRAEAEDEQDEDDDEEEGEGGPDAEGSSKSTDEDDDEDDDPSRDRREDRGQGSDESEGGSSSRSAKEAESETSTEANEATEADQICGWHDKGQSSSLGSGQAQLSRTAGGHSQVEAVAAAFSDDGSDPYQSARESPAIDLLTASMVEVSATDAPTTFGIPASESDPVISPTVTAVPLRAPNPRRIKPRLAEPRPTNPRYVARERLRQQRSSSDPLLAAAPEPGPSDEDHPSSWPDFGGDTEARAGTSLSRDVYFSDSGSEDKEVPRAGLKRAASHSSAEPSAYPGPAGPAGTGYDFSRLYADWWVETGGEGQSDTPGVGCAETRRAKVELDVVLADMPAAAPRENGARFAFLKEWARSPNTARRREFEQHCSDLDCSPARIMDIIGVRTTQEEDERPVRRDCLTGAAYFDGSDILKTKRGVLDADRYEELCVCFDRTAFFLVWPLMLSREVEALEALAAQLETPTAL